MPGHWIVTTTMSKRAISPDQNIVPAKPSRRRTGFRITPQDAPEPLGNPSRSSIIVTLDQHDASSQRLKAESVVIPDTTPETGFSPALNSTTTIEHEFPKQASNEDSNHESQDNEPVHQKRERHTKNVVSYHYTISPSCTESRKSQGLVDGMVEVSSSLLGWSTTSRWPRRLSQLQRVCSLSLCGWWYSMQGLYGRGTTQMCWLHDCETLHSSYTPCWGKPILKHSNIIS